MSGDGLIGQVGGALAETGACRWASSPAAAATTSPACSGSPTEPEGGGRGRSPAGDTREIDVGEVNGTRFLCIASCGFDSDANRIANEAQAGQGQPRLRLRGAAGARRLEAGDVHAHARRRAQARSRGYSVAAANSKAYGGGMFAAPDAELDDGLLDVVTTRRDRASSASCRGLPKVFEGEHVEAARGRRRRAAEVRIEADRPFAVYADGDHLADLPATVTRAAAGAARDRARADAASCARRPSAPRSGSRAATGALSRRSGRGGGTTLPGPAAAADRARRDRAPRRAARPTGSTSSAPPTARRRPRGCSPRRCAPPAATRSTTAPART